MASERERMRSDGDAGTPGKVRGPASYFPSIVKTYGRPIDEWKAVIRAHPGLRHMELVNLLKAEHAIGHGHANALVAHTLHEDAKR